MPVYSILSELIPPKKQIDGGIDPCENRKAIKSSKEEGAANSFEIIAREWGSKKANEWDDKNNRSKQMLEGEYFPLAWWQALNRYFA